MNTVWRVTDRRKGVTIHLEKKPHVRRYMMDNKHHDEIEVIELNWTYKSQLLQIINGAYALGGLDTFRFKRGDD